MPRAKRTSKVIERAETRAAGLRSIGAALDLGSGLTLTAYTTAIVDAQSKLDAYNTALSTVDSAYNAVLQSEKSLADLSERMLDGVAVKFGRNSDEYEMAGGVRKSERKRPGPRKKSA